MSGIITVDDYDTEHSQRLELREVIGRHRHNALGDFNIVRVLADLGIHLR